MVEHSSQREHSGVLSRTLRAVTEQVLAAPWITLFACLALAAASAYVTARHLKFHTSRSDLISPEADYQRRWLSFTAQFGDVSDMVVVVEGPDRAAIGEAVLDLGRAAERDTEHFSGDGCGDDVTVPDTGLAFLGNADGQRAADDHSGLDDHGLGPQPPADKGDQEQPAKPRQGAADEVFSLGAALGFPWGGGGGVVSR